MGICKGCADKGRRHTTTWMSLLYHIEGYKGCYCYDCVQDIKKGG